MRKLKSTLVAIVILITAFLGTAKGFRKSFPKRYLDSIERYSREYHVDPLLVLSVIKVESDFDPKAVSSKGAMGLMQIMDSTANWISKRMGISNYTQEMLLIPDNNIKLGVWYLSWLYDKYQDIDLVIVAYNGGTGNLDKWLKESTLSSDGQKLDRIPFEETDNYLLKVKFTHKIYKFLNWVDLF
ncbi:MAG: lytic transglycosylase domain-containing protein [Clostridiales bacterium]|nr:lytic transglycosylase domain-containing protein [Clostridiales bacterium]